MRWKTPRDCEQRIICKFLWLPLNLKCETRWLEKANIKQEYNGHPRIEEWINKEFV